jgi:hypothetical protein
MKATRKVPSVCPVCGKTTLDYRAHKRHFCSKKCQGIFKHQQQSVTFRCEKCGKKKCISRAAFEHREHHYCSMKCREERVMKLCFQCGRLFARRRSQMYKVDRKSQQRHFCSADCAYAFRNKGYLDKRSGYRILCVNGKQGTPEHRHVMEQALGRKLTKYETVHHKNGVRHDNRKSNLELWSSQHSRGQRVQDLVAYAKEILKIYG